MHSIPWTKWQLLKSLPPLAPRVFAEILDGGQSFRWLLIAQNSPRPVYQGIWSGNIAQLTLDAQGRLLWRAPAPLASAVAAALPHYLALDTDFAALAKTLPVRGDPALTSAVAAFDGLRILRQPFGETLLGFICSATKQIPQIKQMLALLAMRHGGEIIPGHHALPTWPALAALTEEQLRACKLGFRARHVFRAARHIAAHGGERWLLETESAPCPVAKARLLELPGVGEKVADCVLLYGAGRLGAFPVDTWVRRALCENYPRELARARAKTTAQLRSFAAGRFGPAAGLAQQYLFAHARAQKKFASIARARQQTPA